MSGTKSRTPTGDDHLILADPARPEPGRDRADGAVNPWNALWAMILGFFMILLDSTIVAVANPSIMAALGVDYSMVIWVTSAYLLGYAVPLLVAGRLGDQFGPKNLYLIGLAVFTAASLWCGLAGGITELIAARAVQGVGAAMLTPQTLSVITRTFPAQRRGAAMSLWGATAGVATLVGPLAGGVLVDRLGWAWIFFVNVPVGVIGLALGVALIPDLPQHRHRFDLLGVALSGTGIFLLVFALQEGESQGWPAWIWAMIVGGFGCLGLFIYWQAVTDGEPLVPLSMFSDIDFGLANIAVAVIGFSSTAMVLPTMFYAQAVCGMSPTRSALLTAPMAVAGGVLAPLVGKIVDRVHPRAVVGFGFSTLAIGMTWLSIEMKPDTPVWRLVLPFSVIGIGMAFIWSPLAATATRNLPPHLAGAGSGVYNATRQVGAVLGSAAMAAFMTSRIAAQLPRTPGGPSGHADMAVRLPEFLRAPFAAAMSDSTLLPAFVALFGVAAALFMVGSVTRPTGSVAGAGVDLGDLDGLDDLEDLEYLDRGEQFRDHSGVPANGSSQVRFVSLLAGRQTDGPTEPIPLVTPHDPPVRTPVHRLLSPVARSEVRSVDPATVEFPPLPRKAFDMERDSGSGRFVSAIPASDVLAKFGIAGQGSSRPNRHRRAEPDGTDPDVGGRNRWFDNPTPGPFR